MSIKCLSLVDARKFEMTYLELHFPQQPVQAEHIVPLMGNGSALLLRTGMLLEMLLIHVYIHQGIPTADLVSWCWKWSLAKTGRSFPWLFTSLLAMTLHISSARCWNNHPLTWNYWWWHIARYQPGSAIINSHFAAMYNHYMTRNIKLM